MPPSSHSSPARHRMMNSPDFPKWLRRRGYAHFDEWPDPGFARKYSSSPARVAQHSFWPLQKFELRTRRWKADPAQEGRRIRSDKVRPIMYAAHLDAVIYGKYAADLSLLVDARIREEGLSASVLAYRSIGRASNVDHALAAFHEMEAQGDCEVLAVDVKGFFDTLDHLCLKNALQALLGVGRLPRDWYAVFRAVSEYAYVDRTRLAAALHRPVPRRGGAGIRICSPAEFRKHVRPEVKKNLSGAGIPQGTPISAVLANAYMLEYDACISHKLGELGASYRRYSDDILVIAPVGRLGAAEALVAGELARVHLKDQPEKTGRYQVLNGVVREISSEGVIGPRSQVQYLGLTFDGSRVGIRESSLQRFRSRMRSSVRGVYRGAKKSGEARLNRRKLYRNFSHLGAGPKRVGGTPDRSFGNFLHYAYRGAEKAGSPRMRRQVKWAWGELHSLILRSESLL
jgi:RNA-directed DNA polymerase